ncbi:MAG: hypothetical protein C4337_03835 [Armatimonadota bacterium]
MLRKRSKRWFDPELVRVAQSFKKDTRLWALHAELLRNPEWQLPLPEFARQASPVDIDRICEAFAMIVDAKSSFTAEHSHRVATYATQIACYFGWNADKIQFLYRAGLLHDIGKVVMRPYAAGQPASLQAPLAMGFMTSCWTHGSRAMVWRPPSFLVRESV